MPRTLVYFLTFFCPAFVFGQVPQDFNTPMGRVVKFKRIDKEFYLQWESDDTLRTLDYPFLVNGADAWLPRLVSENENYLFFRAGCGSPCWIGIFLPLYKNGHPEVIHEYIATDIDNNLVASVNYDSIEIINLRTLQKQYFKPGNCESAFLSYCIDKAYFKDNALYYCWSPKTDINSLERQKRKYEMKNNWH
jgi:hypothetical protein